MISTSVARAARTAALLLVGAGLDAVIPARCLGDRVTDAPAALERTPSPAPAKWTRPARPAPQVSGHFRVLAAEVRRGKMAAEAAETVLRRQAAEWAIPLSAVREPIVVILRAKTMRREFGKASFRPRGVPARIELTGSGHELLRSVLPHEIQHALLHAYFGRSRLPLWLDEGSAISEESPERRKEMDAYLDALPPDQWIAVSRLFADRFDPKDFAILWTVYAEGYSLTTFLIDLDAKSGGDGRRKLLRFAADALEDGDWARAAQAHYGVATVEDLDARWRSRRRDAATLRNRP